jgi:hypothetical protein
VRLRALANFDAGLLFFAIDLSARTSVALHATLLRSLAMSISDSEEEEQTDVAQSLGGHEALVVVNLKSMNSPLPLHRSYHPSRFAEELFNLHAVHARMLC